MYIKKAIQIIGRYSHVSFKQPKTIWDFWAPRYERLWVQKYSLGPSRIAILNELSGIIKSGCNYNILDMGCGTGQLLREIAARFQNSSITLTGIDSSPAMIDEAGKAGGNIHYATGSAECDYPDNTKPFDIIICSHSFPYYTEKPAVLRRFRNLLSNGGHLILVQACENNLYDKSVMLCVKMTTTPATYLGAETIINLTEPFFDIQKNIIIKEKWFMPSIGLFVCRKKEPA